MPPKKEKTGKKKKAASKEAGEILSPEDQIRVLESQVACLELKLICKTEETDDGVRECTELRRQLTEADKKRQEERQMAEDISSTMTRQYKSMQNELLEKIAERERIIQNLRDELVEGQRRADEQIAEKDRIIEQKDEEVAIREQEMEELCKRFAQLFSDAADAIASVIPWFILSS